MANLLESGRWTLLSATLSLVAGLLGGCPELSLAGQTLTASPSGEATPNADSIPKGEYFPLREGSWWAMSQRFTSDDKPDPGEYAPYSTASIEAVILGADGSSASVNAVTRMAVGCPAEVGVSCPAYADKVGHLYWLKEKSGKVWQGLRSFPVRQLLLTIPSALGSEVTMPASVSVEGYSEKRHSDTVQLATIVPSVLTPAGEFKECLKLESTFTVADHHTDPTWNTVNVSNSTESTTTWLAREIGVIRTVYTKTYSAKSQIVVDTVLASYSVPAN